MVEVSLFPIPDLVAFPGTSLPLHVFEPRYRQMVQDCEQTGRLIAVTDVLKAIHKPKQPQSLAQSLNSNQTTYKPQEVFSAGRCEVVETLADGRILINIHMSCRLRMLQEMQSLPYRIVGCEVIEDDVEDDRQADNGLQELIHGRLVELVAAQDSNRAQALEAEGWMALDPGEFSFKLFQILRLDSAVMQQLLESTSPSERLTTIWQLLDQPS